MEKFKLGPLQQKWVDTLRQYPERQTKDCLGKRDEDGPKYCCLGQALVLLEDERVHWRETPDYGILSCKLETYREEALLPNFAIEEYAFYNEYGSLIDEFKTKNGNLYKNLVKANDSGVNWVEIADFVEANPEKVFRKPK